MEEESTLARLTRNYLWSVENKVGGHLIGLYKKSGESIKEVYEFPTGKFTIRSIHGDFINWDYDVTDESYLK